MCMSILHPNAGISFGYEGYRVHLKDGNDVVGFIASETNDAIVVRIPGGLSNRYRKADVESSRVPLEFSLMPSGLHHAISEQQLIDLVEYLTSLNSEENE